MKMIVTPVFDLERVQANLSSYERKESLRNSILLLVATTAILACVASICAAHNLGPLRSCSTTVKAVVGGSSAIAMVICFAVALPKRTTRCSQEEALILQKYLKRDEYLYGDWKNGKAFTVCEEAGRYKIVVPYKLRIIKSAYHPSIFIVTVALAVLGCGILAKYKIAPFNTFTNTSAIYMIAMGSGLGFLGLALSACILSARTQELEQEPFVYRKPKIDFWGFSSHLQSFKTSLNSSIDESNVEEFTRLLYSEDFVSCDFDPGEWKKLYNFAKQHNLSHFFAFFNTNESIHKFVINICGNYEIEMLREMLAAGFTTGVRRAFFAGLRHMADNVLHITQEGTDLLGLLLPHVTQYDLHRNGLNERAINILFDMFCVPDFDQARVEQLLMHPNFLQGNVSFAVQKTLSVLSDKDALVMISKIIWLRNQHCNFVEFFEFAREINRRAIMGKILDKRVVPEDICGYAKPLYKDKAIRLYYKEKHQELIATLSTQIFDGPAALVIDFLCN